MEKIIKAVEKYRRLILDAESYIWQNPETGYKEFKTTKYLAEKYKELGISYPFENLKAMDNEECQKLYQKFINEINKE